MEKEENKKLGIRRTSRGGKGGGGIWKRDVGRRGGEAGRGGGEK